MSVEMTPLLKEQSNLSKYVVELEQCGPVEVYVEGDLDKLKTSSSVLLTIHDVGSSYNSWVNFTSHEDMKEVKDRSLFLHVCMPGQKAEEDDLSPDYMFPSMQMLGMNLVTVLDQLQISRVVVLGDGAGANIACRFAMCHPSRVHGVVLINCNPDKGESGILNMFKGGRKDSKGEEIHKLNMKNVAKYEDSYRKRDEIISILATRMKAETLLLTGAKSRDIKGSEEIHRQIRTGICSIIKLEDVDDVLEEAEEKAADAIILFCQGVGLVPTVQRKISRKMSNTTKELNEEGDDPKLNMTRKVSMEQHDIPNLRRLSLTSHNI
eukprot:TRINITY_DN2250_c0_g1_i2.p1 TRINITY_DN2250_c0_g1~~TRINITY_DN2250_c0_g1_i2.p1  ORF type:complete len:322 (-),score=110.47 TRINITY_DN2250_c0_g1_i2:163-1128(-)